MTTERELHDAVTANAEDDSARLAYADFIEPSHKDRATFIRRQVAQAQKDRAQRGTYSRDPSGDPLLRQHEQEWTRTIAKYAREWKFDRGFVTEIAIDPYLFLEYGEWLLLNEPIRFVDFLGPEDGDAFPVTELSRSPLINRLNGIGFLCEVQDSDLVSFAESAHLSALVVLFAKRKQVHESVYEAFATAPATKKLVSLDLAREGFPGEVLGETDRLDRWGVVWDWLPMGPRGHALESKYGYIPWLHRSDNRCDRFDAAYFVMKGELPVKQPGTPVTHTAGAVGR